MSNSQSVAASTTFCLRDYLTAFSRIIGLAMVLGVLILSIYSGSVNQIRELHFEREEFANQELINAEQIECSELSQFESALQVAQNPITQIAQNPGTCQGAKSGSSCVILSANCSSGYLPVLSPYPNCSCTCQQSS